MKKLISGVLVLCLTLGYILALPALATGEEHLFYETELSEKQDVLTVSLYTDGLNWTAIDFGISFDPSVLTLTTVNVGSKLVKAMDRGFDFLTMYMEPDKANEKGYCNFVAAVGASNCRVTAYSGPIAVYTFAVKDPTKAKADLGMCVSTLVNSSGTKLLDYTSFGPGDKPVPYFTGSENLFKYGDLNRDGEVTIFDAMLIMQYLVEITDLNQNQQAAALVSGSDEISIYDAMLIMQYLVEMIDTFPAQTPAE